MQQHVYLTVLYASFIGQKRQQTHK